MRAVIDRPYNVLLVCLLPSFMDKQLIITADDFGLTQGVNEAIVRAHRNGVVTSASLMVNGGAFDSAVELAKQSPSLDIGLHLNLTDNPLEFIAALARG